MGQSVSLQSIESNRNSPGNQSPGRFRSYFAKSNRCRYFASSRGVEPCQPSSGSFCFSTVFLCWLIALPEYILQVPANRLGNFTLSATQLKVIQEVISLAVFVVFAWLRLGEPPNWRTALAFAPIFAAVAVVKSGGGNPIPQPVNVPFDTAPSTS